MVRTTFKVVMEFEEEPTNAERAEAVFKAAYELARSLGVVVMDEKQNVLQGIVADVAEIGTEEQEYLKVECFGTKYAGYYD